MPLQTLCQPRPSVFDSVRRATVLDLADFLNKRINGKEFFEENYFTNGMSTLVERAFKQLAGVSGGSPVFLLSQAMGGGKTHSMIGLGLLAQDPTLRKNVLGDKDPAPNLGRCRVIGFSGRNVDASGGIWGSLAEQLGKAELFKPYISPMLRAPGPEAWKTLLTGDPLIIFLDELPPYLEYAVAIPSGDGNLGTITTAALANLFGAVSDLPNVCLILSDLANANYSVGQQSLQAAFDRAIHGCQNEALRIATPLTPVNPNGDELYHILRKRLFERVAGESDIKEVASAYRTALEQAVKMNLTTTSPQALYTRIADSYPFHPDWRELLGRFKENQGFQQTRGVIRLMQMVVESLYLPDKKNDSKVRATEIDLIHPYEINLNKDEIASEVRNINSSLSEAIARDIAHDGDAEAEQIDESNGNTDASEAARVILVASLATIPNSIHGLREYQLVDCLQRPGRDLSTFKANVLDKLALRAWYLHTSADGRLYFKNQQNLAAKLRSTALSLHAEVVDRMLKKHLADAFSPILRDCYQTVHVLPPLDDVKVEIDKTTLVIVRPGGQSGTVPISAEWVDWWDNQQYKNRLLFLSGSRDTFQKVLDGARLTKALEVIGDELKADNTPAGDPQWKAYDSLRDRVSLQFESALKEAFDQIVYPSINSALRASGVTLAFAGNASGEEVIRKTLEDAQKFTTKIQEDSFRSRAETRLFGGADTKAVLWADFKRNAATNTSWPLHKPSAFDDLKADAIKRGMWREEGNHIRKGPFPPAAASVEVRELSREDSGDGATYLKIEALNAPQVVYETGDADPTTASTPVPNPLNFKATGLRYRFRAIDPQNLGNTSPVKEWNAAIRLKYQLVPRGDHFELTLLALPKVPGISIRYTTNGTSPANAGYSTYDKPIRVPDNCRVVIAQAVAENPNLSSEQQTIKIPGIIDPPPPPDPRPARWIGTQRFDDTAAIWDLVARLEKASGVVAHDISLTAQNTDGSQYIEFAGSLVEGYTASEFRRLADALQALVGAGTLRGAVQSMAFPTGQALLDWLKAAKIPYEATKVKQ